MILRTLHVLYHGLMTIVYICNELGKDRPRTWGKAGLGDRLDRRRLIRPHNNRHNPVMVYNDFNDQQFISN